MSIDAFANRLNFLKNLTLERGAKLVVVKDNQLLPGFPDVCKLQGSTCNKSKTDELARQSAKRNVIDGSTVGTSHVFVFDVLEHTCSSTTCSMYSPDGSHIIFEDDDHINTCASTMLTA